MKIYKTVIYSKRAKKKKHWTGSAEIHNKYFTEGYTKPYEKKVVRKALANLWNPDESNGVNMYSEWTWRD